MAARGHIPSAFEGRPIQAPGMMRHGPFPGIGMHDPHTFESVPRVEILEKEAMVQGAEMERLFRENQRFAASHGVLRQELVAAQQEILRIQAHLGSIHTESDITARGLLDKISMMEADIRAGEVVKEELRQAHKEIQGLIASRQELTVEIQKITEELQKINTELNKYPEMHGDLEGLRREHQTLRTSFEYEKSSNMELMAQMQVMEKNLLSVAREVEKLRAEVLNSEKRIPVSVPNPYNSTYTSDPRYPAASSGGGYSHIQGSSYQIGAYGEVSYLDSYGRSQAQASSGATTTRDGITHYGGGAINAGYSDAGARLQHAQLTSGSTVGEWTNLDVYGRIQQASADIGANHDVYGRLQQQAQAAVGGTAGEGANLGAYGRILPQVQMPGHAATSEGASIDVYGRPLQSGHSSATGTVSGVAAGEANLDAYGRF